jgi:hypothetical protein
VNYRLVHFSMNVAGPLQAAADASNLFFFADL